MDLDSFVEHLADGQCVLFLGAGASMGGPSNLPSGTELARRLARQCNYPGPDPGDFFKVCQYYENVKGDGMALRKLIRRQLDVKDAQPSDVHLMLALLPFMYILTTNFDELMERALRIVEKEPQIGYYSVRRRSAGGRAASGADPATKGTEQKPVVSIKKPMVYKLHGTLAVDHSMICTEDDVIQFSARLINGDPQLPDYIGELFNSDCPFLFIGYGLRDWNIRTMIRALRGDIASNNWIKSFAVQLRPKSRKAASEWDSSVRYWDRRENITCVNTNASDFAFRLLTRYYELVGRPLDPPPVPPDLLRRLGFATPPPPPLVPAVQIAP
jgi:hypothetical protein